MVLSMSTNRLHTRIPLVAKAFIFFENEDAIQASTKNISLDGVAITGLPHKLRQSDCRIKIILNQKSYVASFSAKLVHQNDSFAGFHAVTLDNSSLENIVWMYYQMSKKPPEIDLESH